MLSRVQFIEAWWNECEPGFLAFHVMVSGEWFGNIERWDGKWSFTSALEASGY